MERSKTSNNRTYSDDEDSDVEDNAMDLFTPGVRSLGAPLGPGLEVSSTSASSVGNKGKKMKHTKSQVRLERLFTLIE